MKSSTTRQFSESEARQQSYYDKIATTYDEHFGSIHNIEYRARVFGHILAEEDLTGLKALDAMCGGGQNSTYFVSRGCDVTGIDISEKQCEFYKKRFPDNDVVCGSALETGLPDESFDLVFTDSLHHLHPHVDAGITEFHRLLRPGGRLLAWEPSAGSLFDAARKVWYRLDSTYFEDNEASIDVHRLARDHRTKFALTEAVFGGNIAYVLVGLSMAMRIPISWVDVYARPLFRIEQAAMRLQGRRSALWVLAQLEKR